MLLLGSLLTLDFIDMLSLGDLSTLMMSTGNPWTAAVFLFVFLLRQDHGIVLLFMLFVVTDFRADALTCDPSEYGLADRCCQRCPSGYLVYRDCFGHRRTDCLPCHEGTFMDRPTGRTRCYDCKSCDPGSGLELKTPCSKTSDTVCGPQEGFYCTDPAEDGCFRAKRHTTCKPGEYISQNGTSTSDTVCSRCSDGTFSDGTFTSCQPFTQCELMLQEQLRAGTKAEDAQCKLPVDIIASYILIAVLCVVAYGLKTWVDKKRTRQKREKGEAGKLEL